MDEQLKQIYEDPSDPGSYGGVQRLLESARQKGLDVSRKYLKTFVKKERPYTFHKPARKHFSRNPTIVSGIDAQWQADLVDMQSLSRYNKGTKYILTVIDCFSKYAWAVPIKQKTGDEITSAFKHIFDSSKRTPNKLQTDKGREFLNKNFQEFLKTHNVHHFVTENETKAAIVERFNRTLKTRMWTYFTTHGTNEYLDVLQPLVDSYNRSKHRSIGMRPIDVRKADENKIFHRLYGDYLSRASPIQELGPYVRISKSKAIFDKGYRPNWSAEIYKIKDKIKQAGKTVYTLQDIGVGETLRGRFYPEELQTVAFDPEAPQPIEKIVKTRVRGGIKEHLVKWLDFPSSQNSWVKASEIQQ